MTLPVEWIDWVSQQSWAFKDLMGQPVEHSPTRRPRAITSSTSINPLDEVVLIDCSSGAVTLTLETAVGADGRKHLFKKTDSSSNALIIDGSGSETIDGKATFTIRSQDVAITIQSDGANWKTIGDTYSGLMAVPSIVSVLEHRFGVTGDGSTNDATALQAAIDAAGNGGLVIFPKPSSHYFTGSTSLKVRNFQSWIGFSKASAGQGNTVGTTIRYTGTGSAVYGIGLDTNVTTQQVKLVGLRLIGNSAAQVLDMSGAGQWLVDFLEIDSSNASGIGILLGSTAGTSSGGANCYYNTLREVTLQNDTGIGIKFLQSGDSGTNDNRIIGGKNVCTVGVKFEGTGVGALNSGNVIAFVSFENGNAASGRAIYCDSGVSNIFLHNRYEYTGGSALDFLFGTSGSRNLIIGGHFASDVSGMRITDNGSSNSWYASTDTSTVEVKADEFIGDLTGTASQVAVSDAGGDTTTWPLLATSQTGNQAARSDGSLTYNSSSNELTVPGVFVSNRTSGRVAFYAAGGELQDDSGLTYNSTTDTLTSGILVSTQTTGTAPLTVSSTTKVTNLNADLLDDQTGSYYLDSANFTGTNWTDLTDGGATSLHTHSTGTASSITLVDAGADTTTWVVLGTSQTGDVSPATDGGLTYNASTNALTATTFVGALNGNADTVTVADAGSDTTTWILLGTSQTGSLAPASDASLTYNSSTNALSVPTLLVTGLTDTRVIFAGAGGQLSDDSGLTFNSTTNALTATTFVGALNGNADTVTVADAGADTTTWVLLGTSQTGSLAPVTDASLTYNSSTNALTVPSLFVSDRTSGRVAFFAAGGELTDDSGLTYNSTTDALTTTTFVGALNGNADTVTWANEATDTTCFIAFSTAASGSLAPKTNANMTFNSSTGVVTFASSVLTTTDINGGTVDGAVIGGASAAAGTFTTLSSTGTTTLGDTSGDTLTINAGTITIPNLPAFSAYNSADDTNQTGNGATATVDFDTEVYDLGSDFASDTFTAPTTGKYHFDAQVLVFDTTTAMTGFNISLVTSNRTYANNTNINVETAGDFITLRISVDADMDSADTATVTVRITGGAGDTADFLGAQSNTFFMGHQIS